MFAISKRLAVSMFLISLAGCDKLTSKHKVSCSDPEGTKIVGEIVSDEAQKQVAEKKSADGTAMVDAASFRATLAKIGISVESIRTAKEDPNSTKVFCEGTLKLSVPPDVLRDAEAGGSLAKMGTLSSYAATDGFEQSANAFTKSIEYSVQPTDDGKQVFAELTNAKQTADFLGGIVLMNLIKPMMEAKQLEQAKEEETQRLQVQQEAEQQQAAAQQEMDAALMQAKSENTLVLQSIGGLWKSIPAGRRKTLLEEQRQWIKDKESNCRTEAAGKSTNPTEIETYRLRCDTEANTARITVLQQSALQAEESAVPAPATVVVPVSPENPT